MSACRVCSSAGEGVRHTFREHYLGRGTSFDYLECATCGSLSFAGMPPDLRDYYPETYYAYAPRPYRRWAGQLKGIRDRCHLGRWGAIGSRLARWQSPPAYIAWVRRLRLPPGGRVLDVGCGAGALVANLQDAGFASTGIDPFVRESIVFPNGARVWKRTLEETDGAFEAIMLHHVLEHLPSPAEALEQVLRLLAPGGRVLVRIPLMGKVAWRRYQGHWFQIDAPRHLAIPTEEGFLGMAERVGFRVEHSEFDSTAAQFLASEQYQQGMSMHDPRSYAVTSAPALFSSQRMQECRDEALRLNATREGDQAAFYLVRSGT